MLEKAADGGRKPRVTDNDLLDVFRSSSDPVLSTAEVADAVPIKRRGTLNRLRSLENSGEIDSKQIGGRNTVWWLTDQERESTAVEGDTRASAAETMDASHADSDRSTSVLGDMREGDDQGNQPRGDREGQNRSDTDGDDLEEALRSYLDREDHPPKTEHGRSAIMDVFAQLRANGEMKTAELKTAVYREYREQWESEKSMWESIGRYLEAIPGIEKAGYGKWRYIDDDTVRSVVEVDRDE